MPLGSPNYAPKGSKKWIQILVNKKPELFNTKIGEAAKFSKNRIIWVSPLASDKFQEYWDNGFLNVLKITKLKVPLHEFWPPGGAHWDALGRGSSDEIFLVEAKSHIPELVSSCAAKDEESIQKIDESFLKTKQFFGAPIEVDWKKRFYQYANRLAYLYWMDELNEIPTYLINVYFVNDKAQNGPKDISEWKGALTLLYSYFGLKKNNKLQEHILDIFLDVNELPSCCS